MVIFKHNLYKSTLSFRDYKLFILLTGTNKHVRPTDVPRSKT